MDALFTQHKNEYDSIPQVVATAPGVLNLMGEHTDYNKGCVIQTTINKSTFVAISTRTDNSLRFYWYDINERKKTTIPNIKYKREDRWANCLKGVLYDMVNLGFQLKGLDVTITSDIVPGIGLGSSAALEVAFAVAVNKLLEFNLTDTQIIKVTSYAEANFIGRNTEITDQFTSTFGKKNRGIFLDLRSLDYKYVPNHFEDFLFVVVNSNVPGTESVREAELQERKQECSECIEYLNQKKPGKSLRDYTLDDINGGLGLFPDQIRRICTHVIGETQRSIDAVSALKKGNFEFFGRLMNRSHESLRDNYEVSCPELDWLVKRSQESEGVVGARMTGGGFGGCTVSLIRKGYFDNYKSKIREYEHIFGFVPDIFVCEPSAGAKVVYPEKTG